MTSQAYTLSQIVSQLGGEWKGEDIAITAVRPLDQAQAEHISFLANPKYKVEVHDSQAGAVIVSPKAADEFAGRNLIVAADPYLYFAKVARLFSPIVKAQGGVHPTAVVELAPKSTGKLRNRRECLYRRECRIGRRLPYFGQCRCPTRLHVGR